MKRVRKSELRLLEKGRKKKREGETHSELVRHREKERERRESVLHKRAHSVSLLT